MTEKALETAKQEFLNGKRASVRFGGYGGTWTVKIEGSDVLMQATQPRRQQAKIGPNSRSVRAIALEAAEELLARRQKGGGTRAPTVRAAPARRPAGILTHRDLVLSYVRARLGPDIPEDEVLGWGRKACAAYMKKLPRAVRRRAGSPSNLYAVLNMARRLDRDGVVPLDADIESVQPGDLDAWVTDRLARGDSEHTVATHLGRFAAVVHDFQGRWPHEWRKRADPTASVERPSTEHIEPPEIGEDRVPVLLRAMRKLGLWRAVATAMAIDATARRIGSVSGGRDDLHIDAPPLRAADFRRTSSGWEVCWRAEVQKGKAFGRGDVWHPATRDLVVVFRWLSRFHPNPKGPEHPLIWDEADPTRPEPYHRLLRALDEAWTMAFGEPRPVGLGYHGFCRTTITTLAEKAGTQATADLVGRSVKIVEGTYRRVRRESLDRTALCLEELRRSRRHRSRARAR